MFVSRSGLMMARAMRLSSTSSARAFHTRSRVMAAAAAAEPSPSSVIEAQKKTIAEAAQFEPKLQLPGVDGYLSRVVFSVAGATNTHSLLQDDFNKISAVLEDKDVKAVVERGMLVGTAMEEFCVKLKLAPITMGFLAQVTKYREMQNLVPIMDNYFEMWKASSKLVVADITTAEPLSAEEEESLRKQMLNKGILDSTQEIAFRKSVDPEMLGGIRAKVGNNAIDLSLAAKIDRLESQMLDRVESYFEDRLNEVLKTV